MTFTWVRETKTWHLFQMLMKLGTPHTILTMCEKRLAVTDDNIKAVNADERMTPQGLVCPDCLVLVHERLAEHEREMEEVAAEMTEAEPA